MNYVTYDDFKKLDMRVGTILSIETIDGADKLLKCMVDTGDEAPRQILSGIREYYPDYEALIGKQVLYVVNLEPRTIRGHESHGMLMAVGDETPIFLTPEHPVKPGSQVR
jgi:methionyl-tRNA synthetase